MKFKKKNIKKIFKKFLRYIQKKKKYLWSTWWKKYLTLFVLIVGALYLFLVVYGAKYLEGYATFPWVVVNTLEHTKDNFQKWNINFQEINIELKGENINGLYLNNDADYTVYYLHGNGGDLSYFYNEIDIIASLWYNVLAVDYPWYGESTWFPLESDVRQSIEEVYTYGEKLLGIEPEKTILWGYSIGSWVALDFARYGERDFYKIVLEAPYLSRYDLSRFHFGIALQKMFFISNSFVSSENISYIDTPILIIHGQGDTIVPYEQWKQLFELWNPENTYFIDVPDGDHFNLLRKEVVIDKIEDFLSPQISLPFYDKIESDDLEIYLEKKFLQSLDLESDESFQKYVDPDVPFKELSYIPEDLRDLWWEYIIDTKGNAMLRETAAENFENMAEAFYNEFSEKITVVSSYRSYAYQLGIKSRWCPDNLCAKAGYSEHQSGLAIDLWSASTNEYWQSSPRLMKYYAWLSENAYLYGFHNSYQNGRDIDGYEIEPWHWRYVGPRLAQYLQENDITFAQYYYK